MNEDKAREEARVAPRLVTWATGIGKTVRWNRQDWRRKSLKGRTDLQV